MKSFHIEGLVSNAGPEPRRRGFRRNRNVKDLYLGLSSPTKEGMYYTWLRLVIMTPRELENFTVQVPDSKNSYSNYTRKFLSESDSLSTLESLTIKAGAVEAHQLTDFSCLRALRYLDIPFDLLAEEGFDAAVFTHQLPASLGHLRLYITSRTNDIRQCAMQIERGIQKGMSRESGNVTA